MPIFALFHPYPLHIPVLLSFASFIRTLQSHYNADALVSRKSTLIRKFASNLPKEDHILLHLSDSKLTPRWFYAGMLSQLGLETKYYRSAAKRQLQKEIEILRGVHNQKVVCVLDEAHLLEKETIEEFRFLLNYRFDSMSPMYISDEKISPHGQLDHPSRKK